MSHKNNLYTLSYFRKRLKDAGHNSVVLVKVYPEEDKRYWTINIDPERSNIHCTCFKYLSEDKESEFKFQFCDGKQKIPMDRIISTMSMMVILEFLQELDK